MNKKELSDLKKNFSDKCGFFTFNHILRAFIDADKNVKYSDHRLFGLLPPDEQELLMLSLKKALSGTLGKNLVEYAFPKEAYGEGAPQKILFDTLRGKLEDEERNKKFLSNITAHIDYVSTFAVICAHCTYTLFKKNRNDELTEDNSDYNFILTVFCPVEMAEDILIFDDEANEIRKKDKKDRLISPAPCDGFLFPVLTGNEPDVNGVLCYSSKPANPNRSLIEDVLGCEATYTAKGQKEVFGKVLGEIVGDELDYTIITKVNEKINEEIKEHRFDEKPAVIDDIKLRDILYDSGVSRERLQDVKTAFTSTVGDKPLTAVNLISTKTVISTPDITVNISKEATDKVRPSVIGGKRCLVIDLDDPNVVINGLPTTIVMAGEENEEKEPVGAAE